jgi:SAM-dependent methyltransferase
MMSDPISALVARLLQRSTSMTDLGLSADYFGIGSQYDATRDLPEAKLLACYTRLAEQNLFPSAGRILDAGCGTGQVSLALAAQGYHVHGIDISEAMTVLAQSKVRPGRRADYVVGDVRSITAADNSFDAAVVSKLFQHVQDWRQACHEHGREDLAVFMASRGCQPVPVDMSDLRWEVTISYGEALDRVRQRLFGEFWRLPADIHDRLIADTLTWIQAQPDGPGTINHLKPYLVIGVSSRLRDMAGILAVCPFDATPVAHVFGEQNTGTWVSQG